MTTKKQRRERVAENRARFNAETKRMGFAAQQRDREIRDKKQKQKEDTLLSLFGRNSETI